MLYDRWLEVADAFRGETALLEVASGRRWTFGELRSIVEAAEPPSDPAVVAEGRSADFILAVLKGWRFRLPVCPVEHGQSPSCGFAVPPGVAHMKSTSATGGKERWVAFTGAQLKADADNIVATMGLRRDMPNVGVISLAHSYGFSSLVTPLLLHGIPLYLAPSPMPESMRAIASLAPAVTLPAVPALWRTWLQVGAIPANARLAISAGAALPLRVEHEVFERFGLKIHNFYGSTECGGIAYDATAVPRSNPELAGSPMRNVRLSLTDSGCLRVEGTAVGERYWPDPGENLSGGTFITSDLCDLDGDSVLIRGRADDMINVAGRKASPFVIESHLARHPAVKDCLVFGVPSREPGRGEDVVACVVIEGGSDEEQGLRDFLLGLVPPWQMPRDWLFVDSIPINQRGKTPRAEWRERVLASRQASRRPHH